MGILPHSRIKVLNFLPKSPDVLANLIQFLSVLGIFKNS